MKGLLLFFCCVLHFYPLVSQSQWNTVGNVGFSNSVAGSPNVYLDKFNVPYIVFRDNANYAKASLMKFNGNSWEYVGAAGFSQYYCYGTTLAFNSLNQPYVAFTSAGATGGGTVMMYNGSSWVVVGTPEFTPQNATFTTILIDSYDVPYVAFRDFSQGARASVMKFNGTNWVYVGSPGFSAIGNTNSSGASDISFKISPQGELYVSYLDQPNNYKASVMRFDGSSWVYVGAPGFSAGDAGSPSLAFDSSGTPFVGYTDGGNAYKATVMKFDGASWNPLGSAAFTPEGAEFTSLAIDKYNTPYIAYKDYANGQKASLMKFDGSNWVNVGQPGFSIADVYYISLAIDNNGTPYVGYADQSTLPHWGYTTVMKYETNSITTIKKPLNEEILSIFPNPSNGIIKVSCKSVDLLNQGEIKITNLIGQVIFNKKLPRTGDTNEEIDLSKFIKGIYFLQLSSDHFTDIKKLVIE
ncbi:MAG: T9SS type A sorting domain-containing protein [Bacteroidetes bacterium]|nr:T9SS type A sorting domain-containing protein [Bacteroidota bacterium]